MKEKHHCALCGPDKDAVPASPVRMSEAGLTPKAEANKLPRAEQLDRFESDLEAHDSGNQPA